MLLHAFHFDAGVVPPEISTAGTYTGASTTQQRTGAYSLRISNYTADFSYYGRLALATGLSEFYLQFAMFLASTPIGHSFTKFLRWEGPTGTVLGGLKINNSSGKIEVYTGNFATLVATGNAVIGINTWYVIEVHLVVGDSGSITVRVDLNEDSTFSGDTQPGTDTTVNNIRWGNITSGYFYVDDIIVHDTAGTMNNSWPDGAKVYYMVPTGDGATKEWTPSAGSDHYALVDEVPPSVDILTFPDLPGNAQSVKAVIPEVYAFKGSSTPPTRLALGIEIGAEGVAYSADKDLALAQGIVRNVWESRPGGGYFSVQDISNLSLYLKSAA
jgi:hypothetical protein